MYEKIEEKVFSMGYEREIAYGIANMKKKLSEDEIKARRKSINDAIAISTLDADPPSKEAMELMGKYVNGEIELSEAIDKTVEKYKNLTIGGV